MKLLALTVLLAIMQTVSLVPHKTADNPAQRTANVRSKSPPDQAKSPPTPAPTRADSNVPAKTSSEQYAEDAGHSIGISKLPIVTVAVSKRDWADWAYWGFNFMLVAVGGFQVWLLYRTLGAIGRQADQLVVQNTKLEESICVARESVQIIINKERARIRVEVSEPPKLYPHDAMGELNELNYKVFCEGPTPAFIVNTYVNLKVSDSKLPFETKTNIPGSFPAVLHPNTEGWTRNAYLWQKFDEDLEPLLVNQRLFLHFHGIIEYVDVFETPRYTKFRYVWNVKDDPFYGGPHGYWIKNGADEDNKAT
jgi:hypothetical protein